MTVSIGPEPASTRFFVERAWLPAAPSDFSARCRDYAGGAEPAGPGAQALAAFRLFAAQSGSLARAIAKRRRAADDFAPLSPFALGILSAWTVDFLLDCLPAAAVRSGVDLTVVTTPYGQVVQQALDPTSTINTAGLDAVLVLVDHRWLSMERPDLGDPAASIDAAVERLRTIVASLRENGGTPAILCTLATPSLPLFGSYDRLLAGTVRRQIADLNERIVGLARETGSYLLDVEALAERVGTDAWFDPVQWGAYKLPFTAEVNPVFADSLGRLLGAIRGKSKKCLVLDLDNTIWGGVIGDDGLEGIKIGQGSARGEAFLAVQAFALDLRERGIMLAVCSKNDDAVARGPFRDHPDMLLKESHISVFQANWTDKASNLEAIAGALNIGVDALVLLDDNPAERAHVRAALPTVGVPELPSDPSWYPQYLAAAGYFEAVAFSKEDRSRADSYATDAQRAQVMAKARDLGDYLQALDMVMTAMPFDPQGRQRIAQLINKTNQFNLTTRRYSEAEVAAAETDPKAHTMQVRLADKFGDLGMIGVIICREISVDGEICWDIETWLMSCRVLGRKVEEAMLQELVADAKRAGVARLQGTYRPTPKNHMVAEHFDRLGFNRISETPDGTRHYVIDVAEPSMGPLPLRIIRSSTSGTP